MMTLQKQHQHKHSRYLLLLLLVVVERVVSVVVLFVLVDFLLFLRMIERSNDSLMVRVGGGVRFPIG